MDYKRTGSSQPDPDERLSAGLGWFSIGLGVAELLAPGPLARLIGVPHGDRARNVIRMYGAREVTQGMAILAQPRSAGWIWGRVGGDFLDIGSVAASMLSRDASRARGLAAIGALLGVTALDYYCADALSHKTAATGTTEEGHIRVTRSIIIGLPPEQVYAYWHRFENLPSFMSHLESVRVTGEGRSHWVAKAPAGMTVQWEAEITADEPNRSISWRSLPGSGIDNSGTVRFDPATGNRGTRVRVDLEYDPPAGKLGSVVAKLFREDPKAQMYDDLRALKQILETGEKARSDASIFPGKHAAQPPERVPDLALA